MLGSLRFALACLVVLAHLPGSYMPLDIGASAVTLFYFISGRLMQQSYTRFVATTDKPVQAFYVDRFLRLFPVYLVAVAATLVIRWMVAHPFVIDWPHLIGNILLIPVNYYVPQENAVIIPAWSLAAEFHFYAMVPLLFVMRSRATLAIILAGYHIAVLMLPYGSSAVGLPELENEYYWRSLSAVLGYKWPFFIFAVFVLGWLSAEGRTKTFAIAWALYAAFFFLIGPITGLIENRLAFEVSLAVTLSPFVILVANSKAPDFLASIDRELGKLAFPLFLMHQGCIWVAMVYMPTGLVYAGAWALSFVSAVALQRFVEVPVTRLRYAARGFSGWAAKPVPQ